MSEVAPMPTQDDQAPTGTLAEETTATAERQLSPEEKAEIFRTAVEGGVYAALEIVAERFERSPDKKNNLPFHNTLHTEDVIRRFETLVDAIRAVDPSLVDDRSRAVGRFAAAHHDTVQNWEPTEAPSKTLGEEGLIAVMRKRFVGANEAASTAGALALMDKANEEAGTEIFTDEDRGMIAGGHDATIPGFNPQKGTVIQPNLNEQSSIITRAIALADLGTAGIDGKEKYLPEGDALFREENMDIAEAVENPASLTPQQKAFYTRRMLGWSQFQEKFAAGRKAMLEEELFPLPPDARKAVEALFTKFDESAEGAREQAARRANLSFEELAKDMGYTLGGVRE
ncbi:MAG: hypothetical protein Q7S52_02615 [bacterium]|nr:hypothetical protein [bacterium]